MKTQLNSPRNKTITSIFIILAALGLAYFPLPNSKQTIVVVSGTELQEPLTEIETKFEQENPHIQINLKFQGSQDMINNYVDQKNDFTPTVLIPANGEILEELNQRWQSQNNDKLFYNQPQPIAKTILVGVAWNERGKQLFNNGKFTWNSLENAIQKRNWQDIASKSEWGSFDFVMTDPTRSNSGQLTLVLWMQSKLNTNVLTNAHFNKSEIINLVDLIKRSVYQPPRSTDILLQEFIARGSNDADVVTVYESIALYRWQQAAKIQNKPYNIYYLNPTIETVSTAAITQKNVTASQAKAAQKWLDFLLQPGQQEIFIKYGFRPVVDNINLKSVANSPWSQNIPGAEVTPPTQILQPPTPTTISEIQRLWNRAR
jgi:ABC-type molybdate transport system substrate-binding protein